MKRNKDQRPGTLKSAVRRAAGKLRKFATILPLVAASFSACDKPAECIRENQSTRSLVSSPDGQTASLREMALPPENGSISPELADFAVEAQSISSSGAPESTRISVVDGSCFRGTVDAYHYNSVYGEGFFFPAPLSIDDIRILFHEYGHLFGGGELYSEMNALELTFTSYLVLHNQGKDGDMLFWASRVARGMTDDFITPVAIAHEGGATYQNFSRAYRREDAYVLGRIIELSGDFGALRNEIPKADMESYVRRFINNHTSINYEGDYPIADYSLELRDAIIGYIRDNHSHEAAEAIIRAESMTPLRGVADTYLSIPNPEGTTFSYGLEGTMCSPLMIMGPQTDEPCSEDPLCSVYGADSVISAGLILCCLDESGKYPLRTSFRHYYAEDGLVEAENHDWAGIAQHEVVERYDAGEFCRLPE